MNSLRRPKNVSNEVCFCISVLTLFVVVKEEKDLKQHINPSQRVWVRNVCMVLMYTMGPPLRTQNFKVKILKEPQTSASAKFNAIILRSPPEVSYLEMVEYKNQQ